MAVFVNNLLSTRRRQAVAVVLILAVAGVAVWLLRRRANTAEFITEPVTRGSIRNVVNATGTVQALLTVQVGSQVTGQIESLYADFNSIVKRGQVLARLDARRYQAALAQARANLEAARARVTSAQADLNSAIANRNGSQANAEAARVASENAAQIFARMERLRQEGILSQNDYDNAKANADSAAAKYNQAKAQLEQVEAQINSARAQLEQARAQVQQAEANLRQAQVDLEYTTITSPVDGVVIARNVDVGQTVAASLSAPTLFLIANDLSKMQVNASVDEADIGSIATVEEVQFTVDAYPNRSYTGRIAEIRLEPSTVQNVTTYSVIIYVDNDRLELKPGMTANISITVARQDGVLKIPNAALRYLPPGVSREEVAEMTSKARPEAGAGAALPEAVEAKPAPAAAASPLPARAGEPRQRAGETSWPAEARAARSGMRSGNGGGRFPAGAPDVAAPAGRGEPLRTEQLAPGQMWDPRAKIQFPARPERNGRPGIVWVLGKTKQPESRLVMLGITDGRFTQILSGQLQEGEAVIVGDSTQAAAPQTPRSQPFGGPPGGRFIFGGGR